MVHYENPLNVVGTLPVWGDRVLLCKRNIEPRKGKWTLPAGFMELSESVAEGAARETTEEAGAQFEMQELFSILSVPRVGQVHVFFQRQARWAFWGACFECRLMSTLAGLESLYALVV
ncbi:MAG: NUDIX domain-containing protein [Rhodoferax sp.]|nr:NUDIX domain-containing protein [Rhodoferax sp.]